MKCRNCGVEMDADDGRRFICLECGWKSDEPVPAVEPMPLDRRMIAASIYGASIAAQVAEKWRVRCAAPDEDDMRRFDEEAQAVVDLWLEATFGDKQ